MSDEDWLLFGRRLGDLEERFERLGQLVVSHHKALKRSLFFLRLVEPQWTTGLSGIDQRDSERFLREIEEEMKGMMDQMKKDKQS